MLESTVIRDHFRVDAVSTATLFARANEAGAPMHVMDASNYQQILPGLPLADNVRADMENAILLQGLQVTTPEGELAHEYWTGAAYQGEHRDRGWPGPQAGGAGFAEHGDHPLPDWVRRSLGSFFTENAIPPPNQPRRVHFRRPRPKNPAHPA
ncbi:MAG: hypothetical protein GY835_10345 [bacterium]|nr:hypothetical protein [bacterium]